MDAIRYAKRHEVLTRVKEELKDEASKIHELKKMRTKFCRGDTPLNELESTVAISGRYFRHKYIAYCEENGRDRRTIEIPRKDNKPNEYTIMTYKDKWNKEIGALTRMAELGAIMKERYGRGPGIFIVHKAPAD